MNPSKYKNGDTVYLLESASIGSLEAAVIDAVMSNNDTWLYSIRSPISRLSPATTYGDRISTVTGGNVFYMERELCDLCTALNTAKLVLESRLTYIESLLNMHCNTTG